MCLCVILRVRTHDQNFASLIICNKIVILLKINVPSCQINDPPSQMNIPRCQINVPGQINFQSFWDRIMTLRTLICQGSHICVPFWPCVRPLNMFHEFYRIIFHPDYSMPKRANNVALLKLQTKVVFSDKVRPICLPSIPAPSPGTVVSKIKSNLTPCWSFSISLTEFQCIFLFTVNNLNIC